VAYVIFQTFHSLSKFHVHHRVYKTTDFQKITK